MILNCIKNISGLEERQSVLNKSVIPSKTLGPDEAVLELIEEEISLMDDGTITIDYDGNNGIKSAALSIGVSEKDVDNTISFLITLSPRVVRFMPDSNNIKLVVWPKEFNSFREKYPVTSITDEDTDLSKNGTAIKKEL